MLYNLGNSRGEEQSRRMQNLESQGICIFCQKSLSKDKIVYRNHAWTAIYNDFPYRGTKLHLIIVPDSHVDDMSKLTAYEQSGLWKVIDECKEIFDITYYGIGIRNGDFRYNGGTIYHLHIHLIVGEDDPKLYQDVRLRLSSLP